MQRSSVTFKEGEPKSCVRALKKKPSLAILLTDDWVQYSFFKGAECST